MRRRARPHGNQPRGGIGVTRAPLAVLDAALALTAGLALPVVLARLALGRRRRTGGTRGLLFLDCAYSLPVLRARQMEYIVLARGLGGWFHHAWVVHPLVGASPDDPPGAGIGPVEATEVDAGHTMVEGKVSRFRFLTALPLTNFVLGQIAVLRALSQLIRREAVSVVTIADPYYLGVLGYVVARAARLPLVLAVNANHDALYELSGTVAYPRLLRRRSVEKRIDRFVIPRLDMVLVASENNAAFALDNGADPKRLRRVHRGAAIHPMHLADLEARADVRADVGPGRYVICVSRLEPAKHPEDIIDAVGEICGEHPDITAVIVGEGSMRPALEARAHDLGLDGHMRFVGTRDQTWLAGALRDASVMLAPIAGRALLEALLSGTPIVAYDWEWQGELIRDGETGVLVPHGDARAMGTAAAALLSDPERARAIGARAREEILELKDPEKVAAELREQYEWLLDRG
jgi:glycosyltransferase involved in cell wall biosynthesis